MRIFNLLKRSPLSALPQFHQDFSKDDSLYHNNIEYKIVC